MTGASFRYVYRSENEVPVPAHRRSRRRRYRAGQCLARAAPLDDEPRRALVRRPASTRASAGTATTTAPARSAGGTRKPWRSHYLSPRSDELDRERQPLVRRRPSLQPPRVPQPRTCRRHAARSEPHLQGLGGQGLSRATSSTSKWPAPTRRLPMGARTTSCSPSSTSTVASNEEAGVHRRLRATAPIDEMIAAICAIGFTGGDIGCCSRMDGMLACVVRGLRLATSTTRRSLELTRPARAEAENYFPVLAELTRGQAQNARATNPRP